MINTTSNTTNTSVQILVRDFEIHAESWVYKIMQFY